MTSKQIRLVSAIVGASAAIAAIAVGGATLSTDTSVAEPPTPGPVTTSEATTGETLTETAVPEAPETTAFTPDITTTPTSAEPG